MTTATDLADHYVALWNEPDPDRRRAADRRSSGRRWRAGAADPPRGGPRRGRGARPVRHDRRAGSTRPRGARRPGPSAPTRTSSPAASTRSGGATTSTRSATRGQFHWEMVSRRRRDHAGGGLKFLDTRGGRPHPHRLPVHRALSAARTNSTSARRASSSRGVSTTDGAAGGADHVPEHVEVDRPAPMLAWRSAPVPAGSRESLTCSRSIAPVIAIARSTTSDRSSPAAWAWQVSKQKPTSTSVFGARHHLPEPRQRVEAGGRRRGRRRPCSRGRPGRPTRAARASAPSARRPPRARPRRGRGWTITASAPTSAAAVAGLL